MNKCPICNHEIELEVCDECGFDLHNSDILSLLTKQEMDEYLKKINYIKEVYQNEKNKDKVKELLSDFFHELGRKYYLGEVEKVPYYVGEKSYFGDVKKKNYHKAKNYYQYAAKANNKDALHSLGYMYEKGLGGKKDYQTAIKYYQQAGTLGNGLSYSNLSKMYEQGCGCDDCGYILDKDSEKADEYMEKSFEIDNGEVYYLGGLFFERQKDYPKAIELYKKAAKCNNVKAMDRLGYMYEYGLGVKQDDLKASKYYQQALGKEALKD